MDDRQWIRLDDQRQPGMRRILHAMKLIEQEAPGLLDETAMIAATLSKSRVEGGGQMPR